MFAVNIVRCVRTATGTDEDAYDEFFLFEQKHVCSLAVMGKIKWFRMIWLIETLENNKLIFIKILKLKTQTNKLKLVHKIV